MIFKKAILTEWLFYCLLCEQLLVFVRFVCMNVLHAYRLMATAHAMAAIYEANRSVCRYVHSTSRGHEAIQLATAFQMLPQDFVSPYYRDESLLLGMGFRPYELMLQLLAKADDPFSGGRCYYAHPSSNDASRPSMIHQSSATGMQVIPSTGVAQGLKFLEQHLHKYEGWAEKPIVVCSLGDSSVTEGEVSEAFQFAAFHQLPVIYLVQDNGWGISVKGEESRSMNAWEYAAGFKGLERREVDGSDFIGSFEVMRDVVAQVREKRTPVLVRATCPLLGHHTSGVRREFYRSAEDLQQHALTDPFMLLERRLLEQGETPDTLAQIRKEAEELVARDFELAKAAPEPDPAKVQEHVFAPAAIREEAGNRNEQAQEKIPMVDAALFAIREIMAAEPESLLYGQDVGRRLGGVFREAATLAELFGDHRVFNTAIQEAYIIGSTAGLSAVGLKPIVEVQFGDYIYPAINQLVCEIAKSCYLTNGKYPVQTLIRVPVGAYGGGGPYHSGSVETTLLSVKGIKVVYPSNAADMKGLMKAAFYDPNPVVMLEHKGLYWSKVPGTEAARTPEPAPDYVVPLGKGRVVCMAHEDKVREGRSCCVITYGMGVHWAMEAAKQLEGAVEVIDLRTLFPLDEQLVYDTVRRHGKCLVLTEEQQLNSFAEALACRISLNCFKNLDAPVQVLGALNLPAVPMNVALEAAMLPDAGKVLALLRTLLSD